MWLWLERSIKKILIVFLFSLFTVACVGGSRSVDERDQLRPFTKEAPKIETKELVTTQSETTLEDRAGDQNQDSIQSLQEQLSAIEEEIKQKKAHKKQAESDWTRVKKIINEDKTLGKRAIQLYFQTYVHNPLGNPFEAEMMQFAKRLKIRLSIKKGSALQVKRARDEVELSSKDESKKMASDRAMHSEELDADPEVELLGDSSTDPSILSK